MKSFFVTSVIGLSITFFQGTSVIATKAVAQDLQKSLLVKLTTSKSSRLQSFLHWTSYPYLTQYSWKPIGGGWYEITGPREVEIQNLRSIDDIEHIQPNFKIVLPESKLWSIKAKQLVQEAMGTPSPLLNDLFLAPTAALPDNPPLPENFAQTTGSDPLISKQWGMHDIGADLVWNKYPRKATTVVAVIDTGVDYTHEDLRPNIWENQGETGLDSQGKSKSNNGIDDDQNGFVDDVIGWDFVTNDNLPYDLTKSWSEILFSGANPGHGTHCAGNVGARGGNSIGISGVAPGVQIMPIRFISEKGEGTTANAVRAIRYAVDNGARILSNSWGSEGEDPKEAQENLALREVIQYAQSKGVLFIAAAGNGHEGVGYDNDTDPNPGVPASYPYENIISVAATNSSHQLGEFSNWGKKIRPLERSPAFKSSQPPSIIITVIVW